MKICKKICAFALTMLGLSAYAHDWDLPRNTKTVEGFELEDSFLSVYGGRRNSIKTKVYGTIMDKEKKVPLSGIKVALYSGTSEIARAVSQENGEFYLNEASVWAGLHVKYTIIVSDPNGKFKPVRRDIIFDIDEITREEFFILERK